MILPAECVPPRVAAIIWSVVRGARNHREIAADLDGTTVGGNFHFVREAKALGLIDYEPYKANTIRPAVEIVAFTPPSKRRSP